MSPESPDTPPQQHYGGRDAQEPWSNDVPVSELPGAFGSLDWTMSGPETGGLDSCESIHKSELNIGFSASPQNFGGGSGFEYFLSRDYPGSRVAPGKLDMPSQGPPFEFISTPSLTLSVTPSATSSLSHSSEYENTTTSYYGAGAFSQNDAHSPQPTEYRNNSWSQRSDSAKPDIPSFFEVLRKCSDMEMMLSSLHGSSYLTYDVNPCTPTSKVALMQNLVDTAGELVLKIAGKTQEEAMNPQSVLDHTSYEEPVHNISPMALVRDFNRPVASMHDDQLDPASLATAMALAFKTLDVCEAFARLKPSSRKSHHHMIFLKRLDMSVTQIRSAINLIKSSKELCRGSLSNDAMVRANGVQREIQNMMEDTYSMTLY